MDKKAVFIRAKCTKTKQDFVLRFDSGADGANVLTYGLKDGKVPEGQGVMSTTVDTTNLRIGPQYKCPYCGQSKGFVRCGCGTLACYDGSDYTVCPGCGAGGRVTGTLSSVDGNAGKAQ